MSQVQSARNGSVSYEALFEQFASVVPFSFAVVVTTLPRGGLQLTQAYRAPDGWVRSYARTGHRHDRVSLHAISRRKAFRADDAFGSNWQSSSFFGEMMPPHRVQHGAAVGIASPVLPGYPGAIHLYRTNDLGPFDDADLSRLNEFASDLHAQLQRARENREVNWPRLPESVRHDAPGKTFLFDGEAQPVIGGADLADLDEKLRESIVAQAQKELGHLKSESKTSDRVLLPDSKGDLWALRVGAYSDYPAVNGPAVYLSMQPEVTEWVSLQPADFAADAEISRLVNAIAFMVGEYNRGPTLQEISKSVHLSPFHFHRRFTALLGITPKHLLLDCQIERAKRELMSREMELAEVAKACGFAHQSHFTSRFKQATGLTPTRWRRLAADATRA